MREKIICRFETEKDFVEFVSKNNFDITKQTIEFDVHTFEQKIKKSSKKRSISKELWRDEWYDMPEYISEKQEPYAKIVFMFNEEDIDLAKNIFNQSISHKTQSVWYPKLIAGTYSSLRVVGGNSITRYPIYVISKNRSQTCHTSYFLSKMEVPHYVVVEPSDYDDYKKYTEDKFSKIIILDMKYKDNYDTFDSLGNSKGKGPGAARNFCWEDSIKNGFKWHWVMDDNANEGFHYMNHNLKQKCRTGEIFKACEHFVDRYDNIGIAGLNYSKFCKMSDKTPAFVMNTRIYSFLLIRNDINYRWRGRYNEDTDLSLRVLKDGWCTVQFNAFLAGKATTQMFKGGNTEEFYDKEGTLPKSKMLADMHPDVAKVVWKFNRWHHQVDYTNFKQTLRLKNNLTKINRINNFNMRVIDINNDVVEDTKSYLEINY